ncbi:hypothetical protein C0993_003243, partial [Termitomyces sp. T159_Od127]
ATPGRTPEQVRPLLTHSNLKSLMALDTSPLKSLNNARKWLKLKGWILASDHYDRTHLITILATVALISKHPELKTMLIAIAFLLGVNISDHILETLAEAVASKAS